MTIELSTADKHSDTWVKLLAHMKVRVDQLRIEISGDMPEEQTQKYRGRIAELDALIALDKDKPIIEKSSWE